MRLLLASRNRGKVSEVEFLLRGTGWQVVDLSEFDDGLEMAEDGSTLQENARKKAQAAARVSKMWTLADDSGLEIDALEGKPGVHSARFCGPDSTDSDRNRKILSLMVAVPDERRTARFRCVACLVDLVGNERTFEGVCEGHIAHHARGSSGFGYDPIFIPDGHSQTFAELGQATKNRISHRARAVTQVVEYLKARLRGEAKPRRAGSD